MFLDFAGNAFTGDGGVLSMAFHPDFQSNGKFYTATSFNGGVNNLRNRVQEYRVVGGSPVLQRTVLEYDNLLNPFHTLNMMAFDPLATARRGTTWRSCSATAVRKPRTRLRQPRQDLSQLYGKILRVDVSDGADAYPSDPKKNFGIPADNPFAGDGNPNTLGEVYASGFREPFRGSYDRLTGDFYVGNVGQRREEIEFIKAGTWGGDYGWARREGTIQTSGAAGGPQGTPSIRSSNSPIARATLRSPAVTSIAGQWRAPGNVLLRRFRIRQDLFGRVRSQHGALGVQRRQSRQLQDRTVELESLVSGGADIRYITAFGEDLAGNLYIVKFGNGFFPPNGQGEIFRIVPGAPIVRSDFDLEATSTSTIGRSSQLQHDQLRRADSRPGRLAGRPGRRHRQRLLRLRNLQKRLRCGPRGGRTRPFYADVPEPSAAFMAIGACVTSC